MVKIFSNKLYLFFIFIFSFFFIFSLNKIMDYIVVYNYYLYESIVFSFIIGNACLIVMSFISSNWIRKIILSVLFGVLFFNISQFPVFYLKSKVFLFYYYNNRCVDGGALRWGVAVCDSYSRVERNGLPVIDSIVFDSSDQISIKNRTPEWVEAFRRLSIFSTPNFIDFTFDKSQFYAKKIYNHYYLVEIKPDVYDFVN